MNEISERIKNKRLELGITQEELALKVGYKEKSAIAHIEKGKMDLPQSKIIALADALHTTPSYLIDGYDSNNMFEQFIQMDKFDQMALLNKMIGYCEAMERMKGSDLR